MKALRLSPDEWLSIRKEIDKHHPRSVSMVRWKMREVLGFTPREHRVWDQDLGYVVNVHLDFYDEAKRTMFLLKYGDWIGRKNTNC